jgi:UrcA family protein
MKMITKNRLPLLIASAVALGAPLLVCAPAAAENYVASSASDPRATISAADLDLASPAGVARLNDRIRGAAAKLCLTNDVESVETRLARAKCFRTAISSGEWQVEQMSASRSASTKIATSSIPGVGR